MPTAASKESDDALAAVTALMVTQELCFGSLQVGFIVMAGDRGRYECVHTLKSN